METLVLDTTRIVFATQASYFYVVNSEIQDSKILLTTDFFLDTK